MTAKINEDSLSFLDLPAELRNRIYRDVLIARQQPVRINFYRDSGLWIMYQAVRTRVSSNILRTCKHIYTEATSILYRLNQFVSEETGDSTTFTSAIGQSVKFIRDITIHKKQNTRIFTGCLQDLMQATRLQRLRIDIGCRNHLKKPQGMAKALAPLVKVLHQRAKNEDGRAALSILEFGDWLWKETEQSSDEYAAMTRAILQAIVIKE